MNLQKNKRKNNLYPVKHNGVNYYEKDCDEIFLCCYHDVHSLNYNGGVYLSDNVWIYPDGSMDVNE